MALYLLGASLFLLVALLSLIVYLAWPTWKLRHVPTAPYVWGIGHIPLIKKYQSGLFVKLAKEIGPIYRLQLGREPLVFVTTPELCQEIGVKKFKSAPHRPIFPYMKETPIHLHGLFLTRDPRWSKMRNIMLPMFHSSNLVNYVPIIQRVIGDVIDILENKVDANEDVNMTKLIQKMALDVIGETAFGAKFSLVKGAKAKNEDTGFVDAVLKAMDTLLMDQGAPLSTVIGLVFPALQHPVREIMKNIPGSGDWQQHTGNERLEMEARALLQRRQAQTSKVLRKDALSLLLDARSNNSEMEELLSDEYVVGLSHELMTAGSESTATSLCYVLYFISMHPQVQEKVVQEVDRLGLVEVTLEDVDKFTYVDQVIKEGMRMLTFSPLVARELVEDVKLGGYHLPKGSTVWLAIYALAQDASQFPDPHLFRPERFEPNCEENKRRHPYAHSPFGMGPRQCVGYKIGLLQMKLALIHLYQRFTFEHSPLMEKPLATRLGIVVRPIHGVKLRVHKR